MATWSSDFENSNGGGRLGVDISITYTQTQATVTATLYYWSKWSVSDSVNTFWKGFDGSAESIGAVTINTTSNSSWSSNNIVRIGSWSKTYDRTTYAYNGSFACSFSSIEYGGGSGSFSISFTIQARNYYTISYNANGGSGAPGSHGYYYGYATNLSSVIPTRTGYKFLGWSLSSTATSATYSAGQRWSGENANNYTLYAVWQQLYTVTFHGNGGTVNGKESDSGYYTYGENILSLPTAILEEHIFLGWNEKQDGSGIMYTSVMVTGNVTLYAIYEEIQKNKANCHIKQGGIFVDAILYMKSENAWNVDLVSGKQNGIWK